MRAIDYWVGIPLVFLLTLVSRVQRFISLATSPVGRPRNILFIQLAEMGTMVVAYPALRKARELHPDATLHFLCFTQIRSSVEMLEIIPSENIITVDSRSGLSLARDTLRFLWRARRCRIDTVINLEAFVRYSSMLSYLSGACRRVGFHRFNQEGLYAGDLLTHKVLHNAHIHAAHTFLDLVHALDSAPDQVPLVKRPRAMDCLEVPKISADPSATAGIWRKLRAIHADIGPTGKLVVLNPNASDKIPMRRLPLESFTELARRLLEDPEVFVLITGVASEKPDAQTICAQLGSPRALDLTGQTTMTELLHLFDLAQRAGHERLGTGPLRSADTDPRSRLLRAGDPGPLSAADGQLGRDSHRIHLQPVHRSAQPAAVALQRQLVPEGHQHRRDRRAGSLASRGGATRSRPCWSLRGCSHEVGSRSTIAWRGALVDRDLPFLSRLFRAYRP